MNLVITTFLDSIDIPSYFTSSLMFRSRLLRSTFPYTVRIKLQPFRCPLILSISNYQSWHITI